MMNRLHCLKQLSLLLSFLFISVFHTAGQNCPDSLGTNWQASLTNPAYWRDTIYLQGNCDDTLAVPSISFTVPPNSSQNPFGPGIATIDPPGYAFGDTIEQTEVINLTYHLMATENGTGNPLNDTFCLELVYLDTIAPTFVGFLDPANNFTPFLPPQSVTVTCPDDYPDTLRLVAEDCGMTTDTVLFTETPTPDPAMFCPGGGGGLIMRTWKATDPSGNVQTFTQLITIIPDSQAPTLTTLPQSETVSCGMDDFNTWLNNQVNTVMTPGNATDNCGLMSINYGIVSGDTTNLMCQTIRVEFNLMDSCGNVATFPAEYTVIDNTPPVMSGLPVQDTVLLSCGDAVPAVPTVTASDACDTSMIVVQFTADTVTTCPHSFKITRTWSAMDGCGNLSSFTQRIIMEDNTPPTFTVPADTSFVSALPLDPCYFDTSVSSTGDISNLNDNCTAIADILVTMQDSVVVGSCAGDTTIYRTWTATDLCGQTSTGTQKISIEDNKPPSYFFPFDVTISCDASIDTTNTGSPTPLSNNCDASPMITYTDTFMPGGCVGESTIVRTWTIEDACGNSITGQQTISRQDTTGPIFTVSAQDQQVLCASASDNQTAFQNWLNANGNAIATDNCAPDSTISWVAYNAGTTNPATLGAPACPSPDSTVYQMAKVDFVATDPCGNSSTTTATFRIIDNTPPQLSNLPADQTNDTDPGLCNASLTLPLPIVKDDCGNQTFADMVTLGRQFTIPAGSDPLETPIDEVVYEFPVPQPPFSADADVTLTVNLVGVDGESPTEFLQIIAEDGTVLGKTNPASGQCQNSTTTLTISAAQYNQWAFDGIFKVTLQPNIPANLPGRFAVNAICTDSAYVSLDYTLVAPTGLHFEYEVNDGGRIDGGTGIGMTNPVEVFGLGQNKVTYYFTDCSGNETTHTFFVTIEDHEAPTIDCPTPTNQVVGVDPGSCVKEMAIPLFTSVQDNCAVTTPFVQSQPKGADQLLTFSYQPNLEDFLANDKDFVFSGVTDFVAPGFVELTVQVLGDVDDPYEYFEIYDQNNNLLGTTEVGQPGVMPGDSCSTPTSVTFQIPSGTFNGWVAASDTIRFTARAFINIPVPPGGPDSGINPCDGAVVTADGQTDGVSRIWAVLKYESIAPTLSGTGATDISPIVLEPPLQAPVYVLDRGITTLTYEVDDLAGNHGECEFTIEVVDDEAPKALCKPSVFVEINPSGFVFDTIQPMEIDAGSSDNCGIVLMEVSPNIVQCDSPDFFPVQLTVYDSAGNSDVCQTFVSVETTQPKPTIQHNCGNDTLFLFSNPPPSPGGTNAFQYVWRDPNGVVIGVTENLQILDANEDNVGFYTVEITGVTGCTATGVVQVTCDDLPLNRPVLSASNTTPCEAEDFTLTTTPVCGTSVIYKWYQGTAPTGTLLATTTDPEYLVPNTLNFGDYKYYVVVERNGCASETSVELAIKVKERPVAMPVVDFDVTPVCEGGTIFLSSSNAAGASCQWSGPCGFTSNSCNPAPITDITTCNGGATPYTLITTLNGCASEPASVFVTINARPEQPVITNNSAPANNPACVGETITLEAMPVAGALSYRWEGPNGNSIVTADHILTLNNVNLNHQGDWQVIAVGNPCESQASASVSVFVSMPPQGVTVTATPNPICEGSDLHLAAMSSSPDVSYAWTFPDGSMVATQNPVVSGVTMPDDEGVYTVEITNPFGCRTTATVNVDILENIRVLGVSADVPNCVSGPVDIVLSAFPITPANDGTYIWHWSGPDGFTYTSSDSTAIVPDADAINNSGQYQVYVTNASGCVSETKTVDVNIPIVLATPSKPTANVANPLCAGEEVILETVEYTEPVTYIWHTPLGIMTTTTSTLELTGLTPGHTGNYSVSVMLDGCESNVSGVYALKVNPIPVINPVSNSPVCEGEPLTLSMECDGDEYRWEGPGGFGVSNLCAPVVLNANPVAHSGIYKARKKVDGCWSDEVTLNVQVKAKPKSGTAINFGPYCSDTEDVIVAVSAATAPANATFTWYEASTNTPLGSTNQLSFTVPGANLYGNDCVSFYVIATVDGCESEPSNMTEVCMNTIPNNIANAGDDQQICEDETLVLNATPPTVGTGKWKQVSGPNVTTISNDDSPTTTVGDLQPGSTYSFGWFLSNGACEDYSFDEVQVVVDIIEDADAGQPITACNQNSVNLQAVMPASGMGMWSQPAGQAAIGVEIADPQDPNTLVTGLVVDNVYQFTWTIDGGCGMSSDVVNVTVVAEAAFAGTDFEDCGDGCTQLNANPSAVGSGIWTSSDPNVDIISPTSPTTMVCNLKAGQTTFTWTINDGACGDDSVDDVVVTYHFAPIANDDALAVEFGGSGQINVSQNDNIPTPDYSIEILSGPTHGVYELAADGTVFYKADINYIGQDVITYELCTADCSDCSIAELVVSVGADAECVAPSMITPNHDGINDAFIVPCLADEKTFPNTTLSVFNQWGDEVFHASPYRNNWEGTFDGQDLPAGTYYYILDLNNGQKPMTGFFVIQR